MEIGYNWGAEDTLLSVQVLPKENEYYTMGVWKADSYMGISKSSVVVKGGKKKASLSDYDEWAFVKASDMLSSAIETAKTTQYDVVQEDGNTITVKNIASPTKIMLHDVFGQIVYSAVATGNRVSIPALQGFYLLTIDEGKSKATRKVLLSGSH
ncbi:MAG: T9SS type A sorting domain-containing protein [Candidatus Symbiothrix sp.]|nr:T9SS type A sorting domain-containing protein [Candidatus Symbiothrix sp.]